MQQQENCAKGTIFPESAIENFAKQNIPDEINRLFNEIEKEKDQLSEKQAEYYGNMWIQFQTKGTLSESQIKTLREKKISKPVSSRDKITVNPTEMEFKKFDEKNQKYFNSVVEYYEKNKFITNAQHKRLLLIQEFQKRFIK